MKKITILLILICSVFWCNGQQFISCIAGDTVVTRIQGLSGDLQWQMSLNATDWNDIGGESNDSLQLDSVATNMLLRVKLVEENCPPIYSPIVQLEVTDTSSLEFDSEIIVLDTVEVSLIPDSLQQAEGIYTYTLNGLNPISAGDIIIGTEGEGYLRFVNYVLVNGTLLVVHTSQASMDDIFDDAVIDFAFSNDSLDERSSGYNFNFQPTTLFQAGPIALTLDSGQIGMDSDWNGHIEYGLFSGLQEFSFGAENIALSCDFQVSLEASQTTTPLNGEMQLATFSRTIEVLAYGLPVIITLQGKLKVYYSLNIGAEISETANYHGAVNFAAGIQYDGSDWSTPNSITADQDFTLNTTGQANVSVHLALVPELSAKFYGVVVPYVNPGVHMQSDGAVAFPYLDWNIDTDLYADITMGCDLNILTGSTSLIGPYNFPSSPLEYNIPDTVVIVAGDMQGGAPYYPLEEPLIVQVLDGLGNPVSNVPVHFQSLDEDGYIEPMVTVTDGNGYAYSQYASFGYYSATGEHQMTASVRRGNLSEINGSPAEFTLLEDFPDVIMSPNITTSNDSVYLSAEIVDDGIGIVEVGFYYYVIGLTDPVYASATLVDSTFALGIGGLSPYTTYQVIAYATDLTGNTYFFGTPENYWYSFLTQAGTCPGEPSVTDIDGNVYNTVGISEHCWLQRNLDVSHYQNGDVIPYISDTLTWKNANYGAWCYYNFDPSYGPIYGKLYNWYAVNDLRGLAPEGWRIPTEDELYALYVYVGNTTDMLKEAGTAHWLEPVTNANNASGFTALPGGGITNYYGYFYANDPNNQICSSPQFYGMGTHCFLWSSDDVSYNIVGEGGIQYYVESASGLQMINSSTVALVVYSPFCGYNSGRSVRCIKNE